MSFDVAADAYFRFMGRFAEPLADEFVEYAGVVTGQRVLDVGCGPGALTARLVDRVGVGSVAAVEPSAPFVEAARSGCPGSTYGGGRRRTCRSPTTRSTRRWPSWSCTSWPTPSRACARWRG